MQIKVKNKHCSLPLFGYSLIVIRKGFTMVEILLVIAVLAILFVLSVPLYQAFQVRNNFFVTLDVVSQNMSRAQIRAMHMEGDSSWGVKVNTTSNKVDNLTLFRGGSYSGRDTAYDEVFDLYSSVEATSSSPSSLEYVFTKFTGALGSDSCITITAPQINQSKYLRINTKGKITINDTAC